MSLSTVIIFVVNFKLYWINIKCKFKLFKSIYFISDAIYIKNYIFSNYFSTKSNEQNDEK